MNTTLMQDTGFGTIFLILGLLAIATMVLWIFLPFAIFGVKGLLTNILDEQRRTTAALTSLRSDFRTAADKALGEPKRKREVGSAHL